MASPATFVNGASALLWVVDVQEIPSQIEFVFVVHLSGFLRLMEICERLPHVGWQTDEGGRPYAFVLGSIVLRQNNTKEKLLAPSWLRLSSLDPAQDWITTTTDNEHCETLRGPITLIRWIRTDRSLNFVILSAAPLERWKPSDTEPHAATGR
jgi:hypothetical protein